jgi:hypothetical protein
MPSFASQLPAHDSRQSFVRFAHCPFGLGKADLSGCLSVEGEHRWATVPFGELY